MRGGGGGGGIQSGDWCSVPVSPFFTSSVCIAHSILEGSGGMLHQENLSASGAIGDHHNHAKLMLTGV